MTRHLTQHHPHPTLPLKGRAEERGIAGSHYLVDA